MKKSVDIRFQVMRPLTILVIIYILGTVGYKIQNWDQWSWLDCTYMAVITLTTVGYGDVLGIDNLPGAKLYTMVLMITGMGGVLYAVSTLTAFVVEGELRAFFWENRMLKRISKLKNHYILCGAGATGHYVVDEFYKTKQNFVVIDTDSVYLKELTETHSDILFLEDDATDEDVLLKANIKHAKGLAAMLSSDKDNLFLVVTAKALNRNLRVAARAIEPRFISKLRNVGAHIIVSPNTIGGLRLASEILRPHVVSFLDKMMRDTSVINRFWEVLVPPRSSMHGVPIGLSNISGETGLLVIAVRLPHDGKFLYNPPPSTLIVEGSVLIVIGSIEQWKKLQEMAAVSKTA